MNSEKRFKKIVEEIKDVKIQGANSIALAGIDAFLLKNDKHSIRELVDARPTEPLLQNIISILEKSKNKNACAKRLREYIKNSVDKLGFAGADLIKDDMCVFSHCHSSSVIEILKRAKKMKKRFVVYTLEVEPLMQGRKTAEELSKSGIDVVVFPDLAAENALRKCDLFLFGADAFLKSGVVNKIGTSLLCKIAKENNIPSYSCGVSLKYANRIKIEQRPGREVWDERNSKIAVVNPAFDFTKRKLLTGVVSEFGVLDYKKFLQKIKNYSEFLHR